MHKGNVGCCYQKKGYNAEANQTEPPRETSLSGLQLSGGAAAQHAPSAEFHPEHTHPPDRSDSVGMGRPLDFQAVSLLH